MGGLDINWFRAEKGHDPNIIRKSLARRFRDPKLVDTIIEKDLEWRKSNPLTIQSATTSTPSRRNGTISARSSVIRRKPIRKTPAPKRSSSRTRTSSNRRPSRRPRDSCWSRSTSSSTQSAIWSTTLSPSPKTKTITPSSALGEKSLISRSLRSEEDSTITRCWRHWADMTPREDRKWQATAGTS